MKDFMDIFMWVIIGSLVVLIVMNPAGFASAVTSVGGFVDNTGILMSGGGYAKGGGPQWH